MDGGDGLRQFAAFLKIIIEFVKIMKKSSCVCEQGVLQCVVDERSTPFAHVGVFTLIVSAVVLFTHRWI